MDEPEIYFSNFAPTPFYGGIAIIFFEAYVIVNELRETSKRSFDRLVLLCVPSMGTVLMGLKSPVDKPDMTKTYS